MDKKFWFSLALILVVRGSFADQNYIPSGSMEPTIHVGDHVLVNKIAYDLHLPFMKTVLAPISEPASGDIVVFRRPSDGLRLIKRLIGKPRDHIHIESGWIRINGQQVQFSPARLPTPTQVPDATLYREQIGAHSYTIQRLLPNRSPLNEVYDFVVPEDQYFMMGDNRDNSLDSRAWGFVPRENIEGRAVGVIYNLSWKLPPELPHAELQRFGHVFN